MPLRRSPPPGPSGTPRDPSTGTSSKQTYDSDTPSERSGRSNITARPKRKRDDDDIKELRSEMKEFFTKLTDSVEQRFSEIKRQNSELQTCMQYMSDKYDDILQKLHDLEKNRDKEKKQIIALEDRVEMLERKMKFTGLEIRNVPILIKDDKKYETKQDMCNIFKSLAKSVDMDIADYDIKDIYRINSNKDAAKPIMVELNSVLKKDDILQAVKNLNKGKAKGDKLNTEHLKIPGPSRPVYVSEMLTYKAQKLFYMARDFARQNNYTYCWTSKGIVYLRKSDGQGLVRIETESDFSKLLTKA